MLLPARVSSPFVVGLIATRERPELLRRALASVAGQTRRLDALILVEDRPEVSVDVRRLAASATLSRPTDLILLGNRRTPGAAGAWNSGIDEATRRYAPASSLYVAILDDDDWWEAEHIESCLTHAVATGLDMVATAIVRHDDAHPDGRLQEPPAALSADMALVGNPHIQGSNLFVRLGVLLEAGTFDESFRSTTDRDLVVRLADLGATYSAIRRATVHHDARSGRTRLSAPGSTAKSDGLARFWAKYGLRMTGCQQDAFRRRASSLFAAEIPSAEPAAPHVSPMVAGRPMCAREEGARPLAMVVGIAVDGDERGVCRVSPLLEELLELQTHPRVASLDVVLVENGRGGSALSAKVGELVGRGLRCYLADVTKQREDAASGFFGDGIERREGRVGISEARAMTQRYVHAFMQPGAVAWILDDDKRLTPLVYDGLRLERRAVDLVDVILRLRSSKTDIVLGVDTGAAPVPSGTTLRTQLVDVVANVAAMRTLGPDALWPERSGENLRHARSAPDYYYDLARPHTWHLELPFWFCATAGASVRDAFLQLCESAPRMLAGEQVFRPLFADATDEQVLRPSIRRGGSTLVFDAAALVDVPQVVPAADGRPTRRSDMVWALLNATVRGRRVEEAPLYVFHDRSEPGGVNAAAETLVDDIRGYALYSALRDVAERWPGLTGLDEAAGTIAQHAYQKYLIERMASFVLSFHRVRGAARVVRNLATTPDAWWHADPQTKRAATQLSAFAERVLDLFESSLLERVRAAVADTVPLEIATYVRSLATRLAQAATPNIGESRWLAAERVRLAKVQVERVAAPQGELELLGLGHEGVVFTDGHSVFKYLDRWSARVHDESRAFLRRQIGAWCEVHALYPLQRLIERGQDAVLVYPYEPSEPYSGGCGAGLVDLLRELRELGLASRNLHTRNLRKVGERVRLVDYGLDLVPIDAAEWTHMVRRAWLCWRWHHHPDLDGLMRSALRGEIPEVSGWEHLERAASSSDAKASVDALVLAKVLRATPSTVLDYGCGRGALVLALARQGVNAVGFDVRASERWHEAPRATFTTERTRALASTGYDVVVCALVLCTLDDPEYGGVLEDLRSAVREGGTVIISVCNPFHTRGGDTPLQQRYVEGGTDLDERVVWHKRIRRTHGRRRDVHRPLHTLIRDLLRVGLIVEDATETETTDLERLEHASDFIVLRARAMPAGPRVSLLVRASAMEWRTLAVQVRHVVQQLEGPTPFLERVVALDTRAADFLRQYGDADLDAARRALRQLVAEGTIDRVVEPPSSEAELLALSSRWFDVGSCESHTASGAPVAVSLVGLEACSGDYVLLVDDDVLVARLDRTHDYLRDMVAAIERDDAAICASLNIWRGEDRPWTFGDGDEPWRVEVRATLVHRSRLFASRPWPNELQGRHLSRSWHRSLDERVRSLGLRSLRGGAASTFFVHPPNEVKRDRDGWLAVLDRIEAGQVPHVQYDEVELRGGVHEWLGPKRSEPLVVIACGRDVSNGRLARFSESLDAQSERGFGLVVVEDGGSRVSADAVRRRFAGSPNTTVLTLRERRGALANIVWVLRHVCIESASIIVLVDLDDALLGGGALERVVDEYACGSDLTVGGMRRTDVVKPYPVDFARARERRGGNVWQHLRTFRRSLFDRVPDEALRLDGDYVDLAWDWALMLALVEAASAPRYIDEALYLHEPSGMGKHGEERRAREEIIARIIAKAKQAGAGEV